MRVLDLADLPHRPVEAHGSRGFAVGAFGLGADTHLVAVSLTPGGTIGRHPALGRQLLVVLTGEAEVAGAEGVVRRLSAGQAAVWEPGEQHETRSPGGMTAVIVEGDLDIGAPGEQVDPGDT
ncbi:cupin domain-containing protein [Nocardioides okcheonensis]|uniref:cupin domain-containing protein n=1 Tax=Nocardioides okcheonensis TaxID=2894081 RepID=UPI001E539242|nr:cupin domain-containing protein [Nocardioides okcheonensis]UFN45339.1 cupin domain-containing protein [Nocardioides okcheonensis]